jgi:hypothetical protein
LDPPRTTAYSYKEGSKGTGVWSLQKAFNGLGLFGTLVEDGDYGPRTKKVVVAFQDLRHLTADGVAGPRTQADLARYLIKSIDGSLPSGLLLSIIEGESGCLIGAVNWSSAGGVDCGYTQRRVLGPPFEDSVVRRAFDSHYQITLLRTQLKERYTLYKTRPAVHTAERAWRLAVCHHNYPAGADRLSRTEQKDLTPYWTSPQQWVIDIGAKFPTGTLVVTPLQWLEHYGLGAAEHNEPGMMCKYVDWATV